MQLNRQFHAIFCDDIRHEQNGKTTLVGVYNAYMYVSAFPIKIGQLCVNFYFRTPLTNPFTDDSSIIVRKGNEELYKATVHATNLQQGFDAVIRDEHTSQELAGGFFIHDLVLEGETVLEVIAESSGVSHFGGKLWIKDMSEAEAPDSFPM
ncbi:hypothetical protein [Chitinolyticbacter meiyuanensis]|uniref:hypothetical protein n=1 Tax=Chitinolyticbacter meiyuanensis TaxID=682798 RepID=UPI0011E5D9E7|nr:hypothetical protein [Chitinolyticbacter meiyuanensis]